MTLLETAKKSNMWYVFMNRHAPLRQKHMQESQINLLLMVTTGPGGTNALTGVTAAYIESTPMIVLSGQVKRADMVNGQGIRQQGMQEVDIISMVKPVMKYAALVTEPQDIKYHLDRALYGAVHGRKDRSGWIFRWMYRHP